MYKNNLDWYDRDLQKYHKKNEKYSGRDKERIKELMGDNLYGIAFIRLEKDKEERTKK